MIQQSIVEVSKKISTLKCCVIIPTYNNAKTIQRVIEGVLLYTNNIIIVNDGCTDGTVKILENYPELTQIHFKKNKGKGAGLRAGFKKAIEENYKFAITIDSDGQHYPDDIPLFISELEKDKNLLLIGSRNMTHDSVPKKSSFGNNFSNFWFWAETGISLTDTQSGYRMYPLEVIDKIRFYTTKFEFEIEVIVKAAWRNVKVKNIPIKVLYDPDERVSHFRPIKDFARISVLNTWLVLVAILYIHPRNFLRKSNKKGFKRFFLEDVLHNEDSSVKKSFSIALGIFIGLTPFWGFHTLLVISLSVALRLNKVIAFAFSNVSIPPMIPFIVYGSIKFGNVILGTESNFTKEYLSENFKSLTHIKEYLVGSFALATIAAVLFGGLGFLLMKLYKSRNKTNATQ